MSDIAIRVEGLGKQYRIGSLRRGRTTLRETIALGARDAARMLTSPVQHTSARRAEAETIWALRDVSFDIPRGEAFGIIGANGAGKSTLLKILSRITEPTRGSVRINGRVGSLLEVGTGFHSELTGRENVYLNGAILGMKRREIDGKFDEIVAFAGVEKFIDTPVKHYSTGMYLRLAFAVAAHLEPEILIVDEVLAVGDVAFQKKCLGKMGEVSQAGRTVLLVSHNMDAILRLCPTSIVLDRGGVVAIGDSARVVADYLSEELEHSQPDCWIDLCQPIRRGDGEARFAAVRYSSGNPGVGGLPYPYGPLDFTFLIDADTDRMVPSMAVVLHDPQGHKLLKADIVSQGETLSLREGQNRVSLRIEAVYLNPGEYGVSFFLGDLTGKTYDHIESAFTLRVVDSGSQGFGITSRSAGVVPCRLHLSAVEQPVLATDGALIQ